MAFISVWKTLPKKPARLVYAKDDTAKASASSGPGDLEMGGQAERFKRELAATSAATFKGTARPPLSRLSRSCRRGTLWWSKHTPASRQDFHRCVIYEHARLRAPVGASSLRCCRGHFAIFIPPGAGWFEAAINSGFFTVLIGLQVSSVKVRTRFDEFEGLANQVRRVGA